MKQFVGNLIRILASRTLMSRRRLARWTARAALGLVVAVVVLIIFVTLTPWGRAGFHTALFVSQVLELGVKPQGWFTSQPVRQEVTYPQAKGEGVADIYRITDEPGAPGRAAVLIFLGANAAGRDDKDVINLGNALARSGFVVMVHWSPTMALRHNIDPDEIENLVWAFQYLAGQDYVDPQRLGMGGFCVGASFALVAAADPRINGDVAFLNAFGPYYDAPDLLLQVASRSTIYQDQREPWDPDITTMRVLANELVETLEDSRERALLEDLLINRVPVSEQDLAGLSVPAQGVRRLLEGTSLEEARLLYQSLPAGFREGMNQISPSAHHGNLKARVTIMHDRN
ncbi:MAG: hypothetical protein BZY88_15425, partial [SAR202 cluster bacterium Io17-Chloro-G9]